MPTDTFGPGPTNSSGMSKLRLAETPSPCPGCTVSNLDPNATAYTPKGSLIASTEAWIVSRQVETTATHLFKGERERERGIKCSILYSNKIEYVWPFPMTCFLLIVVKPVSDCLYACCFPGFRKFGKSSLLLNGGMHVRIFVFCTAVWWTLYSVNSLQPKHQQSTWLVMPVLAGFRTTHIFSVLIHAKVKSVTHIWPCCLPFFSICSILGNFIYASCGSVCGSVSNSRVVIVEWVLCEYFEYLFLVPYLHKLGNLFKAQVLLGKWKVSTDPHYLSQWRWSVASHFWSVEHIFE